MNSVVAPGSIDPPLLDGEPPIEQRIAPGWEFFQAPIVPITLTYTLGQIINRYFGGTFEFGLLITIIGFVTGSRNRSRATHFGLAFVGFGLGFSAHQLHHHQRWPADIGWILQEEPQLLRVRGLISEPTQSRIEKSSITQKNQLTQITQLQVQQVSNTDSEWFNTTGQLRIRIQSPITEDAPMPSPPRWNLGDTVEIVGRASAIAEPNNPGEIDQRRARADQHIRGDLYASDDSAVTQIEAADWSLQRLLLQLRNFGKKQIQDRFQLANASLANALLLGDGSAMTRPTWEAFLRTGVVHVLIISGQHLMLLAVAVWLVCNVIGIPRRQATVIVMAFVVLYAGVTGLRPSAIRATIAVLALCGSILLRRPPMVANTFAIAWLVVNLIDPSAAFDLGCRLSFLSVFVLIWGMSRWLHEAPPTPLEQLLAESRPAWFQTLRRLGKWIGRAYMINAILLFTNAPLLLAEQNIVSPISLLVGPILILFASIALLFGFAFLVLCWLPGIADALAYVTQLSLELCQYCVTVADHIPGGTIYAPGPPTWWLVGLYLGLAALILLGGRFWKRILTSLLVWLLIGLSLFGRVPADGEFRITVLAVGHGNCTVLETPDERCFLYDAGSLRGADVVRTVIAPYLWHRRIRQIDEVFLSHADLDHYNGLSELFRRFAVGQLSVTPSFAGKPTSEVAELLLAAKESKVPLRVLQLGQQFRAGEVIFEVLHPPEVGPEGVENERSLVLQIDHAGHRILLTGDLEKKGTERLLQLPSRTVDVLVAPHHGSQAALPERLLAWCQPKWLIVSRGNLYSNFVTQQIARRPVWHTQERGAIFLRSHTTGLVLSDHKTGEKVVLRRGSN